MRNFTCKDLDVSSIRFWTMVRDNNTDVGVTSKLQLVRDCSASRVNCMATSLQPSGGQLQSKSRLIGKKTDNRDFVAVFLAG